MSIWPKTIVVSLCILSMSFTLFADDQTVSAVRIADQQSERQHNLQGSQTRSGSWREAADGGWFSYDMPVLADEKVVLQVTYFGSDDGDRVFDIFADGTLIGTKALEGRRPGEYFDVTYPIPEDITAGKEKVTIKFQALPGYTAGGIYDCRILRFDESQVSTTNPLFQGADPDFLLVDDTLWIYPTHRNGIERRFFAYSSQDMINWQIHGPVLDFHDIEWIWEDTEAHAWGPGWADGNLSWAPGTAQRDGKYYFYYSVGPKPSHIGVAVADHPAGPFEDPRGEPLISDHGNPEYETIDAMVFIDPVTDTPYLYAGGSAGAKLLAYELNDDMISIAREIDVDTPPYFTEGPFMHYRDGIYYMSYSHGIWFDGSYTVRYATSDSPLGPWDYHGVILESNEHHRGPGHHSIMHNPKHDQWFIIYHRWDSQTERGPYDSYRKTAINRFDYDADGLIKPIEMEEQIPGPTSFGK